MTQSPGPCPGPVATLSALQVGALLGGHIQVDHFDGRRLMTTFDFQVDGRRAGQPVDDSDRDKLA